MVKRSTVKSLPVEILTELNVRLMASNFGDYDQHAEWLKDKGFPISKSSIHRYAADQVTNILADAAQDAKPSLAEVRLRCLEVSASLNQSNSPAVLISQAEELLKWVYKT